VKGNGGPGQRNLEPGELMWQEGQAYKGLKKKGTESELFVWARHFFGVRRAYL